jgi:hypothetical protein
MTISPEPDGTVSFRVLIGADDGRTAGCDLIEVIISPEHLSRALGGLGTEPVDQRQAFPCHVGICRNAVNDAA